MKITVQILLLVLAVVSLVMSVPKASDTQNDGPMTALFGRVSLPPMPLVTYIIASAVYILIVLVFQLFWR